MSGPEGRKRTAALRRDIVPNKAQVAAARGLSRRSLKTFFYGTDVTVQEAEKLRMDADAYAREYRAEFSDITGAYFAAASIEAARKEYSMAEVREDGKAYAIGFDPARVRDSSVVTVVSKDGVFKSKVLDTGDRFSFRFAKPGQFGYFCSIHPHMTGTIVVKT